ncbi:LytR/AlgR family response regulator transcription factor [Flavihumibacter solisilvae]|uniref:LytR/AlgR family response regulator transcription factor n=1 Tax=Flavihumibacter solisilvae TaxID=1349421 RepID=UPI0009079861|nr:LytTR family DNA-binding domain-containing protein [Flavihumibacter solisilvae]
MPVTELILPNGTRRDRVPISMIRYIEVNNKRCRIVTNDTEYFITSSLRSMESRLPETQFARIHHSYLVGIEHIKFVGKQEVDVGTKGLPISKRFRPALIRKLTARNR